MMNNLITVQGLRFIMGNHILLCIHGLSVFAKRMRKKVQVQGEKEIYSSETRLKINTSVYSQATTTTRSGYAHDDFGLWSVMEKQHTSRHPSGRHTVQRARHRREERPQRPRSTSQQGRRLHLRLIGYLTKTVM